jgi:hypothetical protein
MAMFCYVHNKRFFPSKEEVSSSSTHGHGQAQPDIVSHENEHKEVGQNDLKHVKTYGFKINSNISANNHSV